MYVLEHMKCDMIIRELQFGSNLFSWENVHKIYSFSLAFKISSTIIRFYWKSYIKIKNSSFFSTLNFWLKKIVLWCFFFLSENLPISPFRQRASSIKSVVRPKNRAMFAIGWSSTWNPKYEIPCKGYLAGLTDTCRSAVFSTWVTPIFFKYSTFWIVSPLPRIMPG